MVGREAVERACCTGCGSLGGWRLSGCGYCGVVLGASELSAAVSIWGAGRSTSIRSSGVIGTLSVWTSISISQSDEASLRSASLPLSKPHACTKDRVGMGMGMGMGGRCQRHDAS